MSSSSREPAGRAIAPIGLGCMGMSGSYGAVDEAEALRTFHRALDPGIALFDIPFPACPVAGTITGTRS